MAGQIFHHLSRLAEATIDCTNPNEVAFTIPEGARVVDITLEVVKPAVAGTTYSLGLEGATNSIFNGVDIATAGATYRSDKVFTSAKTQDLLQSLSQASDSGELIARIVLFLPSTILYEY